MKSILNPSLQRKVQNILEKSRKKIVNKQSNAIKFAQNQAAKKNLIEEEEEDVNSIDEEDLLAKQSQEEIKVDFKFCDVSSEGEDEMWIRALISNGWIGRLLQRNDIEIRKLSKAIADQIEIGTFVKTEDDDESIYSFITVLNAAIWLPKFLQKKIKEEFGDLIISDKVGWVLREQIINVPPNVNGPLLNCLKDDLIWAKTNANVDYEYFLLFSPCYVVNTNDDQSRSSFNKKARKKQKIEENIEYSYSEDLVFANDAFKSTMFHLKKIEPPLGVDEPESVSSSPWSSQVLLLKKKEFLNCITSIANV